MLDCIVWGGIALVYLLMIPLVRKIQRRERASPSRAALVWLLVPVILAAAAGICVCDLIGWLLFPNRSTEA